MEKLLEKTNKITTWLIIPSLITIIVLLVKIESLLSNIWDKMEWWHP